MDMPILPWDRLGESMEDQHRNHIVNIALRHLPHASPDLQKYAYRILTPTVPSRGFRPFRNTSVRVSSGMVAMQMKQNSVVTPVIICLWAEANRVLLAKVRTAAELMGLHLRYRWPWHLAIRGYYPMEMVPSLWEVGQNLIDGHSGLEAENLNLALLWLSRAVINGSSDEIEENNESEPQRPPLRAQRIKENSAEDTRYESSVQSGDGDSQEVIAQDSPRVDNLEVEFEVLVDMEISSSPLEDPENSDTESTDVTAALHSTEVETDSTAPKHSQQHEILMQLDQVLAENATLRTQIATWPGGDKESDSAGEMVLQRATAEQGLSSATDTLNHALQIRHQLEQHLNQLRELGLARITILVSDLNQRGVPKEAQVTDELRLEQVTSKNLSKFSASAFKSLEKSLIELRDQPILYDKLISATAIARELQDSWDDKNLVRLLEVLAAEKRDVEAFLLLLAANVSHSQPPRIYLSQNVIISLLQGVWQLSDPNHPFELLNLLAPLFIKNWMPAEPEGLAQLCLVFLGAHYAGGYQLPEGFLWQLGTVDWPVATMVGWGRIWEIALEGNTPVIDPLEASREPQEVEQRRSKVRQQLARENGFFVRLHSFKSRRHQALFNNILLPNLVARLERLNTFEQRLQSTEGDARTQLLQEIESFVWEELQDYLSQHTQTEIYESEIAKNNIDDSKNPFHRRVALNYLHDCAGKLFAYAEALAEFWMRRVHYEPDVSQQVLQDELRRLSDLSALGHAVLHHLMIFIGTELYERDEAQIQGTLDRQLTQELLRSSTYALRLPRVLGHLNASHLDFQTLLPLVLDDLAEPLKPKAAVTWLIEHEAPNQVLSLSHDVPLATQKHVQQLIGELEREMATLTTELLKLGGRVDDLAEHRAVGRWRLMRYELTQRLNTCRLVREEMQQRIHQVKLELFKEIHNLDLRLFEQKEVMPADAYQLIRQGLTLAREAVQDAEFSAAIQTYLATVNYLVSYQYWEVTQLQSAYTQLESFIGRGEVVQKDSLTVEQALSFLEYGDLQMLGLPETLSPSEIKTRVELLHAWLKVRALPDLMAKELTVPDRENILELFRCFARIVAMRQFRDPTGKPLAGHDPITYSYWELQYPKHPVLEKRCVLITLLGQPPSARHQRELVEVIEKEEWLRYYFVFLFAPGATENISRQLRSRLARSGGQGLVIIDEQTILKVVVQSSSTTPLGHLRALMLNTVGAAHIDVFKINQLVTPHSAIFAGRDNIIKQLASGGGNYALYGGRRIGKSSVLAAVEDILRRYGAKVVSHSFEGDSDLSDDACAIQLARLLELDVEVKDSGDLKHALQSHMDAMPDDFRTVLLLDEIDRYIDENRNRHVLIETLRTVSDRYRGRLRVIVAGFMELYDCLREGGQPYSPTSDPWRRMFNDEGPLKNLRAASAETIIREGFLDILGWKFENQQIPHWIVAHTSGHPAFVQYFCKELQHRVSMRGDGMIHLEDAEAVFEDPTLDNSFMAFIGKTLEMNLDSIGRYLIFWLVKESSTARGFTYDQVKEIAELCRTPIPEEHLNYSLGQLRATSVVHARRRGVFEFTVPDYPLILDKLGGTDEQLKSVENAIPAAIEERLERLEKRHGR